MDFLAAAAAAHLVHTFSPSCLVSLLVAILTLETLVDAISPALANCLVHLLVAYLPQETLIDVTLPPYLGEPCHDDWQPSSLSSQLETAQSCRPTARMSAVCCRCYALPCGRPHQLVCRWRRPVLHPNPHVGLFPPWPHKLPSLPWVDVLAYW